MEEEKLSTRRVRRPKVNKKQAKDPPDAGVYDLGLIRVAVALRAIPEEKLTIPKIQAAISYALHDQKEVVTAIPESAMKKILKRSGFSTEIK